MAALSLHHAIFANEKDSKLPLRSASSFLQLASERDGSSSSQLFSSTVYQDLIQRQPTHPDGPTMGWDLGLNLLGDPVTAAEHKNLEVHQVKMKLRRLRITIIAFELLFGIWGLYTTVRYCIAFAPDAGDGEHVCALILGIISSLAVALMITSVLIPLLPPKGRPHAWRPARLLIRVCYLVLLTACAVINAILVLVWHPDRDCGWDIDILWYTRSRGTVTSSCHTTPFAVWLTAAIVRLVVTSTVALSFLYVIRSHHATRHPSEVEGPNYTPYLSSEPEQLSPVSASSPIGRSKSTFKFPRSEDSNHTLGRSSVTLPKSSSISTLAPSTSCTGHSRSHSTPPSAKDVTPPRISPPTSRRTSSSTHAAMHHHHGALPVQSQSSSTSEMPSLQTQQPVIGSAIPVPSPISRLLRRTSRISVTQLVPSDTTSDVASSRSERLSGPTITRDLSEIRSGAPWNPSHRGTGVHPDTAKKTTTSATWDNDNAHVRRGSQTSGTFSDALSSIHDDGKSIQEKERDNEKENVLVYSYGYGASGHTYPYLDMYNPQGPHGLAETSTASFSDDPDARGQRCVIPSRPGTLDLSPAEPRFSISRDHETRAHNELPLKTRDELNSGEEVEEEEEYVAMMGGFVRRMATIESLGSKEAAGTLSSNKTGSMALKTAASSSLSSASQFSSVRFAAMSGSGSGYAHGHGHAHAHESSSRSQSGASFGAVLTQSSSSRLTGSTAYLSFSSGGTDMMRVNERGELLPPGHRNSTSPSPTSSDGRAWLTSSSLSSSSESPHDRHHRHPYAASLSGSS